MGEFDEFITGKIEMEVGGKKLKLNATIKDKRKLKSIYSQGDEVTEDKLEVMDTVFLEILTRSYPNEQPEALEGFYTKYDIDFLQKFFVAVGWAKEEDFQKTKQQNPN